MLYSIIKCFRRLAIFSPKLSIGDAPIPLMCHHRINLKPLQWFSNCTLRDLRALRDAQGSRQGGQQEAAGSVGVGPKGLYSFFN
jgi:hypothetical protein